MLKKNASPMFSQLSPNQNTTDATEASENADNVPQSCHHHNPAALDRIARSVFYVRGTRLAILNASILGALRRHSTKTTAQAASLHNMENEANRIVLRLCDVVEQPKQPPRTSLSNGSCHRLLPCKKRLCRRR